MARLHSKPINEHYFDLEGRTEDELKRRYYVLGAFYANYAPAGYNGIRFSSSSGDLVQIVSDELESQHRIGFNEPSSYWIEIHGVPYLRSKLEELGLADDKSKRKFPGYIPDPYLDHFIRGFFDAQMIPRTNRYTNLVILFNNHFLVRLHHVLSRRANVKRDKPPGNVLFYAHKDSLRIYQFIYRDWQFIKKYGLYLQSKKNSFRIDYRANYSTSKLKIASLQKVERAKHLLRQGHKPFRVAKMVGYSRVDGLSKAFKRITGKSITSFINWQKRARV